MVELSTLDWAVLAGFFVLLLGVVVMSMRQKEEDTADYFLAGRNASWLVIGDFRIKHWLRTFSGSFRFRCTIGYGTSSLGDAIVDHSTTRLDFRAFLLE